MPLKRQLYYLASIALLILLVGCSTQPSETLMDDELRIEILYSHTLLMSQYANETVLKQIGLDMSVFPSNHTFLNTEQKLALLAQSYNMTGYTLELLEDKMVQIMKDWYDIMYPDESY